MCVEQKVVGYLENPCRIAQVSYFFFFISWCIFSNNTKSLKLSICESNVQLYLKYIVQTLFQLFTKCSLHLGLFVTDKTKDTRFRFTNCSAPDQVEKMRDTYLTMLRTSPYGFFCTKFRDLCRKENVKISCEWMTCYYFCV